MKILLSHIEHLCFVACMLVVSVSISAQEVKYPCKKQLEKAQFNKAFVKLQKQLQKDTNDCEVHYALFQYYFAEQNPDRNIRAAYRCLEKAEDCFNSLPEKKQAKLLKRGYSSDVFPRHYEEVGISWFNEALEINTVEAYVDFLEYCQKAGVPQRQQAIVNRNALAFKQAEQSNTISDYQNFINKFPYANEVQLAQDRIYELAFNEASATNTIDAYENFISAYPQAPQVKQAQSKMYELAFNEASEKNTIDAYEKFIAAYSETQQAKQAQNKIYELAYQEAVTTNTEKALRDYAAKYPNSPYNEQAIHKSEALHCEALLATLPSHPDIPTLKQAISQWSGAAKDSCLLMLHDIYASTYDIDDLKTFYDEYDAPSLSDLRARDSAFIRAADNGDLVYRMSAPSLLASGYINKTISAVDENGVSAGDFIRMAAPNPLALAYLKSIITSYLRNKQWNDARQIVAEFADAFGNDQDYQDLLRILSSPVDPSVKITKLGPNINSADGGEYCPFISADGKKLLFCGKFRSDNIGGEDIFIAHLTNKGWGRAHLMPDLNVVFGNEAPLSLSADGTSLIHFRSGTMWTSHKEKHGWSTPEPLPDNINITNWQSDAMLTSDGKAMLFAAEKQSNYEFAPSINIYVSLLDENGEWGEPIDLGPTINTSLQDRSPFLHPDMKTLYFSSEGHSAIGGMDVFMSKRLSDDSWTEWSEPINLGKEINSVDDDCWYKISTDGKTAYFSKGDDGSDGDIYTLNLPQHLRPQPVATISGKLTDIHHAPIATEIRWEDLESQAQVGQSHTDPEDGSFFIVLPTGKNYGYYIDDDDYFPVADNLDLRNTDHIVQIEDNITVASFEQMINEEIPMPLNNLFFNTGKYELLPPSIAELQRVIQILKTRQLKVEISGHTDNVGTDADNQILSERRAEAVRNYLVDNGFPENLIVTIGYGESKPVATNKTEAGRRKNRRVEIKFIK